MTEQQIENMKWKLPDLIYAFVKEGRMNEVMESFDVGSFGLLSILAANSFPNEQQLKSFCDHFKLSYSTLKTWNVLHLVEEE